MAWGRKRLGADRDEFDRALRRSLRAAIEGDGARAQSWLERAVELDSADLDAYQALARLYRDRGEIGRAIRMHQNLLLRSDLEAPERAVARLELARDFETGGFRDQALATYEALLAERPRDAAVLEAFARALHAIGDRDKRDTLLVRLRRLDPEVARALDRAFSAGGVAGSDRGEGADVAGEASRAGIVSRFVARFGRSRNESSQEAALRSRLEQEPRDGAARIALAHLIERRSGAAQAREIIERGLADAPNDLDLHRALGRLVLAAPVEGGRDAPHDEAAGLAIGAYGRLLDALDAHAARSGSAAAASPMSALESLEEPAKPREIARAAAQGGQP